MANYYGVGRTNYFRVKDRKKFEEALELFPVSIHERPDNPDYVCMLDENLDGGGWAWYVYDEENDEDIDGDPVEIIALVPGEVVVLMEAGFEKHRYVVGYAIAFDHTKKSVGVSLDDIYNLAKNTFGGNVTTATY